MGFNFSFKAKVDTKKGLKMKGDAAVEGVTANGHVGTSSKFEEEVLQAHNECRRKHNVPPATWSKTLAANAQKWANQVAKKGRLEHAHPNQRKGEGENIACAGGQPLDGRKATMMWYDEIKDYDFTSKPTYNPNCGHFTQVVWASSTEIGAGIATSKKGMHFVVARYSPGGNNLNLFEDNIKPPQQSEEDGSKQPCIDEECIAPVAQDEVHESPNVDLDNLSAEVSKLPPPKPFIVFPGTKERSNLEFEMKQVRPNEPSEFKEAETVEVTIRTQPIKGAYYHGRSEHYIQPGKSYQIVHYTY